MGKQDYIFMEYIYQNVRRNLGENLLKSLFKLRIEITLVLLFYIFPQ